MEDYLRGKYGYNRAEFIIEDSDVVRTFFAALNVDTFMPDPVLISEMAHYINEGRPDMAMIILDGRAGLYYRSHTAGQYTTQPASLPRIGVESLDRFMTKYGPASPRAHTTSSSPSSSSPRFTE